MRNDRDKAEQPDEKVRQGNAALAAGHKEAAIHAYRQALDSNPHHPEARFQLAHVFTSRGDFESALHQLDQLLAEHPQLAPAHFNRGNVLFGKGQFVEATEAYRAGLALSPHPEAFRNLGQVWQRLDRHDQAIQAYQQALALDSQDVPTMVTLAAALLAAAQPQAAEHWLRQALQREPRNVQVRFYLGNALTDQSRPAEALAAYVEASQLDPDSSTLAFNRGHVLTLLGRWEEAVAAFQRALEIQPRYTKAYVQQGIAWVRLAQTERAAEVFRQCIARDDEAWEPIVCLGDLHAREGQLTAAAEAYERAVRLRPNCHASALRLATVYARQRRLPEAAQILIDAHQAHHDNVSILLQLGKVQWGLRAADKAEQAFRTVLEIDPGCRDGYHFLARLLIMLERYDEAREVLQAWLEVFPGDPVAEHLTEAGSQQATPLRAADAYVQQEFDRFAETFDEVLQNLAYRAPELLGAALAGLAKDRAGAWNILDVGCGTGLCGPHLKPLAQRLVGVDLSAKMIAQARKLALYDELITAELTAYLQGCATSYDVVVAADTLVYFGELAPVVQAVAQVLPPNGIFMFTVEQLQAASERERFRLNFNGRFSHAEEYLRTILARVNLGCVRMERIDLRNEGGYPVAGLLVSARRQAAAVDAVPG